LHTRTESKPSASVVKGYQKLIKGALDNIAALAPEAGCCVSETALIVRCTVYTELKDCRDLYRTAFELLADRGFVRREYIHWRFKRRFTAADVSGVIEWPGKWKPTEAETNNR
jgi:hypothetical protein